MKKILLLISILSLLFGTSVGNKNTVQEPTCKENTCTECEQNVYVPSCEICENIPQESETVPDGKAENTVTTDCENESPQCDNTPADSETVCENNCDTDCEPYGSCETDDGKCNNEFNVGGQDIFERINEIINSKITVTTQRPETGQVAETQVTDEQKAVFDLVNKARTENGLKPLQYRQDIQTSADLRAEEIVSLFSHTRPDGSNCFTVLKQNGISYMAAGENIAYGQRSAEEVMNGWMNSSGHRANILSGKFTGIAIGLVKKGNVKYWVQIFVG